MKKALALVLLAGTLVLAGCTTPERSRPPLPYSTWEQFDYCYPYGLWGGNQGGWNCPNVVEVSP